MAQTTLTAIFEAQDRISDALAGIGRHSNKLTEGLKRMAKVTGTAFSAVKISEFGNECAKAAMKFETGMSEVYTMIPDISNETMKKLDEDTKKFSKKIGVLTEETVPALYQSLSAGISKDNVFNFLEVANKAAIGGVSKLDTAVDGLSSVINAYGEKMLPVQKASDLMFTTVRLGKTTFDELASSLYNVVPTAVGANVKFDDISAALAAMTAQGIPTSVATTQLRQSIVELSKSGTETDKIFKKIAGKSFKQFVKSGNNMQDAFQLLEKHAHKTGKGINDLFGSVEAGNAVLALTGQGTEKFTNAVKEMESASGATDKAFSTIEKTGKRKLDKIKATWEVAKIDIGDKLIDSLYPAFEYLQNNMDDVTDGIKTGFNILGDAIKILWNTAEPALQWMKQNPDTVSTALAGIGGAIITKKVASGLFSVGKAAKVAGPALLGLGKALFTTPAGLFVLAGAGIAALGVGIYKCYKKAVKTNLDEHFGKISLSAQELDRVAKAIVQAKNLNKLQKATEAFDVVASTANDLSDVMKDLDRQNWEISIGMKMDKDQFSTYQSNIDQFIKNSLKLVTDKKYAINLSIEAVYGNSVAGAGFKASANSLYDKYSQDLTILGERLQKAVIKGYENGWTIDESNAVQAIMKSMNDINAKVAQAQSEARLDAMQLDFLSGDLSADSFQELQKKMNDEIANLKKIAGDNRINLIAQSRLEYDAAVKQGKTPLEELNKKLRADIDSHNKTYQKEMAGAAGNALQFQTDTILKAYGPEIDSTIAKMSGKIKTDFESQMQNYKKTGFFDWSTIMYSAAQSNEIDPVTKGAMSQLFDLMKPTQDQLMELAKSYDFSPELMKILNESAALGTLVDDKNSFMYLIGNQLKGDATGKQKLFDSGMELPEMLVLGATSDDSLTKVGDAGTTLGNKLLDGIKYRLENGVRVMIPVTATTSTHINYDSALSKLGSYTGSSLSLGNAKSPFAPKITTGNANGTLDSKDIFVAGERGPELIMGKPHSTVFPNRETNRLIDAFNAPIDVPVPKAAVSELSEVKSNNKTVTLEVKGSGKIQVDKGVSKDKVLDILTENVRPVLMDILQQELFEEGDLSYEF